MNPDSSSHRKDSETIECQKHYASPLKIDSPLTKNSSVNHISDKTLFRMDQSSQSSHQEKTDSDIEDHTEVFSFESMNDQGKDKRISSGSKVNFSKLTEREKNDRF